MKSNELHKSMLSSPMRTIRGKVELYKSSTPLTTFRHTDNLVSFTVNRVSAKKFYGYGVTQALEVKLLDKERAINIKNNYKLDASFEVEGNAVYPYPRFNITDEFTRDETTNELTIKAVDNILYYSERYTFNDLNVVFPIGMKLLASYCASLMGLSATFEGIPDFNINSLNVDGTESLRAILDDIAEATQTIYYQDGDKLIFKRLSINGSALFIKKADYFTLTAKETCKLSAIGSANDLEDNVIAYYDDGPYKQISYNNSIFEGETSINLGTILENGITAIGGLTITPFNLKWRGNYLLEIGDSIYIAQKDNITFKTFVLDEQTTYNGGLVSTLSWDYDSNHSTSFTNPTTLGDKLNQTIAKVDKANQEIILAVNKIDGYDNRLTQLELDSDGLTASVSKIQTTSKERFEAVDAELTTIMNRVEATMTPEEVSIKIQEAIGEGANKITTETGFTFNEVGLTVSKSGSEMTTTITEDGMSVYKDGSEVLTADNTGVKAIDLSATTYLHIGTYSRFQDYGEGRTGCFWII